MAIVAPSHEQMQAALGIADKSVWQWGLQLRIKQTKCMAVGCAEVPSHFCFECGRIETVSCFKNLGSYLADNGKIGPEVTHRV